MKFFRSGSDVTPTIPHDPRAPQGFILFEIDDFEPLELLFGDLLALEVTEQVEKRLMPRLPHGSALWRPERGQFALNIPESNEQGVTGLANDLKAAVARTPISSSAGVVMITLSAGCSLAEPSQMTLLGPAAKRALDLARAAGRARTRLLPADCVHETEEEVVLKTVRAIQAQHILLHYQPVMRVGPGERIAFHECLARVPNDGSSPIRAAQFIEPLEAQGQLHRLDRLVLSQALDVLEAHPGARLSINLSADAMLDPEWMAIWDRRRLGNAALADRLIIELTDKALLKDPLASGAFIERLRASGAAFLLDGFGVGAITREHLETIRFDIVKLAPSITAARDEADTAPGDRAARLDNLMEIASGLDLMVVAGQIETPNQLRWLMDHGVEYAQGRYYGMPDANPFFGPAAEPGKTAGVISGGSASPTVSASR